MELNKNVYNLYQKQKTGNAVKTRNNRKKKKQEFLLKLNVSQQIIIKTPDYDKKRKTKEN